jgi:bifunctional DNA-binding transcriptional regulator/antitoxin component of YhaV-PrlF toxin-antitoxin module
MGICQEELAWEMNFLCGYGKISLFPYFLSSLLPCFLVEEIMLAKLTVKNQLTIPKAVATRFEGVEYFEVSTDGSTITLRPLRLSKADEVRQHLANLGITEQDIKDAIAWARESH